MKMVTTADLNMVASLMETIPSWIPFCRKSSISRLCAKEQEDGALNKRLATCEKSEGARRFFCKRTKNILAVSDCNEGRSFMSINSITLVGIALIVLGIVALAYQGITYTSRERVIDIGPIHATADTQKTIPLSPLLGGLALAGGIVLVVFGAKKSS
jgi:uncharacterized membrane protein